jgi:hypothetical protein
MSDLYFRLQIVLEFFLILFSSSLWSNFVLFTLLLITNQILNPEKLLLEAYHDLGREIVRDPEAEKPVVRQAWVPTAFESQVSYFLPICFILPFLFYFLFCIRSHFAEH